MPGLFAYNWLLVKKKGIYKILNPISFVGRDAKCPIFIYSNMFQQHFYREIKVIFFSVLSSTPLFLSRPVSYINNSAKTHYNWLWIFNIKEKVIILICWKVFSYIVRKIRQRIFLLFYVKDLLTTGENSWKAAKFYFKGFHFKSTSGGAFNKAWWKSRNHTEIRNSSETYLEPSQRSMLEPFCVNS